MAADNSGGTSVRMISIRSFRYALSGSQGKPFDITQDGACSSLLNPRLLVPGVIGVVPGAGVGFACRAGAAGCFGQSLFKCGSEGLHGLGVVTGEFVGHVDHLNAGGGADVD